MYVLMAMGLFQPNQPRFASFHLKFSFDVMIYQCYYAMNN